MKHKYLYNRNISTILNTINLVQSKDFTYNMSGYFYNDDNITNDKYLNFNGCDIIRHYAKRFGAIRHRQDEARDD